MSNARNSRRKGSNPLAVLANDSHRDPVRSGAIASPRKVMVTARVSIGRDFTPPQIEMGEYTPVDLRATELVAGTCGWNGAEPFEPGPTVVNHPQNHLPVGESLKHTREYAGLPVR